MGSPLGVGATTHQTGLGDRLEFMAALNIERTFLLPGFVGLAAHCIADSRVARALVQAHNRLVYDLCTQAEGLLFVPVVLPHEPEWSIKELRRWQGLTTIRAVVSRPTTIDPRPYRQGMRNPLLSYLADQGLVLMLHGATGYHQVSPMADLFEDYRFTHVLSHPFEHMTALTDLIATGAMKAGLKVGLIEAGCGWVPWFLNRLQEHFDYTGGCASIGIDVLELSRERLLLGVEPADPGIPDMLSADLLDILAFGSDFPHWDAVKPKEVEALAVRYGPDVAHRFFSENADRFFFRD